MDALAGSASGQTTKKKVLLMGRSGSGKTSMRSIIFADHLARDTRNMEATFEVDPTDVHFMGNLSVLLWDCGGQEAFMESYFTRQRDYLFRNVSVLIYVFDVESKEYKKDLQYYRDSVEALQEHSPETKIFVLIHKMDLLPEDQGDKIFKKREHEVTEIALPMKVACFKTSIWDETLYKAWSQIVYALIPNILTLENQLKKFCAVCEADEVVLFEMSTFLVISLASSKKHKDVHRFEKISNIVKQFKLSCNKMGTQLQNLQVRNSNFVAFIESLTRNTAVMIILSDPNITAPAIRINVAAARKYFTPLIEATS
mmetsp:Transcript_5481/g.15465  ORF Transcript_5481/g.15465 Transcript_5481/m.15465 type:complete len:313 (-) Transcript_5481:32-970(-)|eukprot:CAMPEP_0119118570 /NCGR_PEP_ID=MMETSP1310-20130426/407_1 /TAXON_ID=464262 /ORGANISM="Genus nov. species nov., Strain RCC2339" /LENGTH=312 /DNA_ID=CAMNT_0007107953 /DNA_START=104 /DNA_END=1045 /DNA_ORIENTATION=-